MGECAAGKLELKCPPKSAIVLLSCPPFMSTENRKLPAWARQERRRDLEWINENVAIFWAAATASFEVSGRGAIVVDTTTQPSPDAGHPFGYLSQNQLEQDGDEDTKRMLSQYDPSRELVP
ncbi:MAG TPA: hypothetical protein VMX56_02910, partial [Anaerolineales bacterium]|nr:hypothetical protein [Anaerolineales bacterium]